MSTGGLNQPEWAPCKYLVVCILQGLHYGLIQQYWVHKLNMVDRMSLWSVGWGYTAMTWPSEVCMRCTKLNLWLQRHMLTTKPMVLVETCERKQCFISQILFWSNFEGLFLKNHWLVNEALADQTVKVWMVNEWSTSHQFSALFITLEHSLSSVAHIPAGPRLVDDRRRREGRVDPRLEVSLVKVARWQNLIPSFPWIAPGWRAGGAIQGNNGIKFCSLA